MYVEAFSKLFDRNINYVSALKGFLDLINVRKIAEQPSAKIDIGDEFLGIYLFMFWLR